MLKPPYEPEIPTLYTSFFLLTTPTPIYTFTVLGFKHEAKIWVADEWGEVIVKI